MSDLTDDILDHLYRKKAVILQGPPGTGKTYHARRVVERLIANSTSEDIDDVDPNPYRWHEIAPDERHPHFSIESKDGESTDNFDIPDAHEGLSDLPVVWELVQLHSGYAYEDLVRGMGAEGEGDESSSGNGTLIDGEFEECLEVEGEVDNESKGLAASGGERQDESEPETLDVQFEPRDRIVPQLARVAHALQKEEGEKLVVLVLDEINRCSLAEVLGELILLIEADKRSDVDDEGWPVRLKYPPPTEGSATGDHTLTLPDNLWIVGTMNTADRSIAMVDYAIRRRFRFVDVPPSEDAIRSFYQDEGERKRGKAAEQAFEFFEEKLSLDQRFMPGHSYFMEGTPDSSRLEDRDETAYERWRRAIAGNVVHQLAPLLEEYHREAKLPESELTFEYGEDEDEDRAVTFDVQLSTWRYIGDKSHNIEEHEVVERLIDWSRMGENMHLYDIISEQKEESDHNTIWSRNVANWFKYGFVSGGASEDTIKQVRDKMGEEADLCTLYIKDDSFVGIAKPLDRAMKWEDFSEYRSDNLPSSIDDEWDWQDKKPDYYIPVKWLASVGVNTEKGSNHGRKISDTLDLEEGFWKNTKRGRSKWNRIAKLDDNIQKTISIPEDNKDFGSASDITTQGTADARKPVENLAKWRFLFYYIVRHFEDVDDSFDRNKLPDEYEEDWVNRVEDRLNFVEFVGEELPERLAGTDSLEGGGLEPETNDAFDYNTGSHDGSWQKREPQTSRQDDNKVIYKQDGLEVTVEHDGSNWQITFEDMENGNKTDPYPLDGDEWEGFMEDDE
jgi:hypothetical protein